ncbi:MAG: DUF3592 domain-containing protein [Candidatus Omnitrophica bacterium]|nr:DUF3592 domain-containing protein [Candidatus Omnitrophota bacterium]
MKKFGAIAFSSIFVIVGIIIMIFGLKTVNKARESEGWLQVEGTVISSKIETHQDSDSGSTYSAEVLYEYTVNYTKINGNKIKFVQANSSDSSAASRYVNKYPEGKEVTVYYNSEDPYEAVLEPGVDGSIWFFPLFGLVFALFGSEFVVIAIFSKESRGASPDFAQQTEDNKIPSPIIIIDVDDATTGIEYGVNGELLDSVEFELEDGSLPSPDNKWFEAEGMKLGDTITIKSWMKNGKVKTREIKVPSDLTPPVKILVHETGDVSIEKGKKWDSVS